ncbi:MAG: hypothetical protein WC455_14055 [Dehalococcoidia bacterium]
MSTRGDIYDAVIDAFESSTGFKHVTKNLEPWWDWSHTKLPGICVIDGEEPRKRFSFPHGTSPDMEGRINFTLHIYDRDRNDNLAVKIDNDIAEVRKVILNTTTLNDLVLLVKPGTWEKVDEGLTDNYIYIKYNFEVWYLYNHLNP